MPHNAKASRYEAILKGKFEEENDKAPEDFGMELDIDMWVDGQAAHSEDGHDLDFEVQALREGAPKLVMQQNPLPDSPTNFWNCVVVD